jgi:hypothetical protein
MPARTLDRYHHVPIARTSSFKRGSWVTQTFSGKLGIKAVMARRHGETKLSPQKYLFDRALWTLAEAKDWVREKRRRGGNPQSIAERVYHKWHGFKPRGKTVVDMGRTLSGELVYLGDVVSINYRSDKWNGRRQREYRHRFNAQSPPPLLFDPKNNYLIIPGPPVAGSWSVEADGIVN